MRVAVFFVLDGFRADFRLAPDGLLVFLLALLVVDVESTPLRRFRAETTFWPAPLIRVAAF